MQVAELYKRLKKFKGDGFMNVIATAAQRDKSYIYRVLKGECQDDNVVDIAKEALSVLEEKHGQRKSKVRELVLG